MMMPSQREGSKDRAVRAAVIAAIKLLAQLVLCFALGWVIYLNAEVNC